MSAEPPAPSVPAPSVPAPAAPQRVETLPSLLPLLAVNFVGTLGFSIVLPFLVFLVTRWGGDAILFGLIGATYSAFQLVGAPVLGRLSDRIGRRKVLLLSQLGTALSWCVLLSAFFVPVAALGTVSSPLFGTLTLTLPLLLLFAARAVDGLTGGNVSVANAYLADITNDADRAKNFGRMALAGNLGFVAGPALAGLLAGTVTGEIGPVLAALVISVFGVGLILFGLKEADPCADAYLTGPGSIRRVFGQEPKDCVERSPAQTLSFSQVLALGDVPKLLFVYFLVMLGFSFFYVGFPVHAVEGLNWTVGQAGVYFAYLSLAMVLVQGPVLAKATTLFSDETLAVAGTLILAAGFAALLWDTTLVVYGAATLIALGNGLMWPSVLAMLSRAAGPKHQGAVQGAGGSVGAAAAIAGLIVAGFVYALAGTAVFLVAAAIVLPVAGLILMCRLAPKRLK